MSKPGAFEMGNKAAKKSIDKEIARKVVQDEIAYCAHLITQVPIKELRAKFSEETYDMDEESLFTNVIVNKALRNDVKAIQWVSEMIAGRPKQQIEQKITEQSINISIDKDDVKL